MGAAMRRITVAYLLIGGAALVSLLVVLWVRQESEPVVPIIAKAKMREAMDAATLSGMNNLLIALKRYNLDCGGYPGDGQGLQALTSNQGVAGWAGPYLGRASELLDSWGTPYRYTRTGIDVRLESAGADTQFGTSDDVELPSRNPEGVGD